ncbi:MAG TPA: pyridoxamine 5'-phosphate oxidase family protein [Candidatus Dormibacteraeota bacterium]|jgi:hypothetical protein|nr:pyridoxamine 5'-phosphate oxidase family protein [Candidatus Dormibacteraeota bacterium]HEX2679858.1 pyridoxamine 5'-phosphate oxidase family protein [Candidatus Dormibacteraeota bacterium]
MTSTRSPEERKADVLAALEKQGQYFLATAKIGGGPHIIGVSAMWSEDELVLTTLGTSRTAKNIAMNPQVVLAGGDPSDAIVIQAQVIETRDVEDSPKLVEEWKAAMGWDPSEMEGWVFYRLRLMRIQAFRGYDEIGGRDVMLRGRWVI